MISAEQKATLMALLSSHPVAIVATASKQGIPSAAVVLFAEQDDGSLIFGTHPTRKYENLMANPAASFVVSKGMEAIQFHGHAEQSADQETAKKMFMKKHPEMDQHLLLGSIFFHFTPSWVRYLNYGVQPPIQWETELL